MSGRSHRWGCTGAYESLPVFPRANRIIESQTTNMPKQQIKQTPILVLWAVLLCCVIIGSLLPAASPVMVAIGRLDIWDKLQHFGAYLALSFLPVIGFKDRRQGLKAGLSMFLLGILMEAGQ